MSNKISLSLAFIVIFLMIFGCGKSQPKSLMIGCDEKFHPALEQLGIGFHEGFGVELILVQFHGTLSEKNSIHYDLILTDEPPLLEKFKENGLVTEIMDFCYTTPVFVMRQDDSFQPKTLADFAKITAKPLRLSVASEHETLATLVRDSLKNNRVTTQGGNKQIQFVYHDKKQSPQNLSFLLEQLHEKKIDIVACWDFDLHQALKNSENKKTESLSGNKKSESHSENKKSESPSLQVISWSLKLDDSVKIPLGITKNCTDYAAGLAFFDFIKSNVGQEILRKSFQKVEDGKKF